MNVAQSFWPKWWWLIWEHDSHNDLFPTIQWKHFSFTQECFEVWFSDDYDSVLSTWAVILSHLGLDSNLFAIQWVNGAVSLQSSAQEALKLPEIGSPLLHTDLAALHRVRTVSLSMQSVLGRLLYEFILGLLLSKNLKVQCLQRLCAFMFFRRRHADMTFSHLASLRGSLQESANDESIYRTNGFDESRIRNVLKNKKSSGCKCSRQCRFRSWHIYFLLANFEMSVILSRRKTFPLRFNSRLSTPKVLDIDYFWRSFADLPPVLEPCEAGSGCTFVGHANEWSFSRFSIFVGKIRWQFGWKIYQRKETSECTMVFEWDASVSTFLSEDVRCWMWTLDSYKGVFPGIRWTIFEGQRNENKASRCQCFCFKLLATSLLFCQRIHADWVTATLFCSCFPSFGISGFERLRLWMAISWDLIFKLRLLSNSMDLTDEDARAKLLHQLMNDALIGPTAKIANTLNPKQLAVRELPPGNWAQTYILYQSFCLAQDLDCASRATFYQMTQEWRKCLKFRPFSKHSLCNTCDRLKSRMRHCKDFMAHASAADDLLAHLKETWECRKMYWNARQLSQSHHDVLCLCYDGFDKSKPVLPRWAHGQLPKHPTFERLSRTNVAIAAVLAHGHGCFVYLSQEGGVGGGTFSYSVLSFEVFLILMSLNVFDFK